VHQAQRQWLIVGPRVVHGGTGQAPWCDPV
jgi:hypothetical protein